MKGLLVAGLLFYNFAGAPSSAYSAECESSLAPSRLQKLTLGLSVAAVLIAAPQLFTPGLIGLIKMEYRKAFPGEKEVNGVSMRPTYQPGERIRFEAVSPDELERGDIVEFALPGEHPVFSRYHWLVKRVIGLPGEEVTIDSQGRVWIDGEELEETYIKGLTVVYGEDGRPVESTFVVPEEHFFVLGDHRMVSADSRKFGSIPGEQIISRADLDRVE